MFELKSRRICLDFHTSEKIPGIGSEFDPDEFGDTLQNAGIQSMMLFSRCHHGVMYYDSKRFPERVHPGLVRKNLLNEQIEACKKRGIQATIYTSVEWDHYTATEHPEWLCIDDQGRPNGTKPFEAGFLNNLCMGSPYKEFYMGMVEELIDTFDYFDSILFDIVMPIECSCLHCKKRMLSLGMNPADSAQRKAYAWRRMNEFKTEMSAFVRARMPDCGMFFNRGYVGVAEKAVADAYTHYEVESLPSGKWGYMNFPVTSRYVRNMGKQLNAQTGKFHTAWGDNASFKNRAALEYECFNILAMNYQCTIGDQLEPRARLNKATYELIGSVFRQVEKKEPWCEGAKAVTDVCVFTPEEFWGSDAGALNPVTTGVTRMLQELGHQFDIVDSQSDISRFKLAVLPDNIPVNAEFAQKLESFAASGGGILASYQSALGWRGLGVEKKGPAPFSPDFIVPQGEIGKGLPETEHVMYTQGTLVEPKPGAEVLAWVNVPYFNRTWEHFSSHLHTPSSGKRGYPGIVRNGNVIYFIHPVFTQYDDNAPLWCKKLVANAIDILMPERLVRHSGPSTMLVTLNAQESLNRLVLHALHYIPERRSKAIDVVEDVIPLYNVSFEVAAGREVKAVTLAPEMRPLEFSNEGGKVKFVLPELNGHQMVEIKY